jgi:hypothetical protein
MVKMYPKNFTHPILVKKSYLYRGTQPRITIKNAKHKVNFEIKIVTKSVAKV